MKSCDDIRTSLESCCDSCHEDKEEFGYPMCEITLPDGSDAEVCCAVARGREEVAPEEGPS